MFSQNLTESVGLQGGGFHADYNGNPSFTNYKWPKRTQGGETIAFIGDLVLKNVEFDGVKVTFYSAGGTCTVQLEGNIVLKNGAVVCIQNNHGVIKGPTLGTSLQNYEISSNSSLILKTNNHILVNPKGFVQDNSSLYIISSGKCTLGWGNYGLVGFKIGKEVIVPDDHSKVIVVSDDNMHLEGAIQAFGPGSYSFETDGNINLIGFRTTWRNHDNQDNKRVFRFWCGNELGIYAAPESSAFTNIGISFDNPVLSIANLFRINHYTRYEQKWFKKAGEYFTSYHANAKTNCDEAGSAQIIENENILSLRSNTEIDNTLGQLKIYPNPSQGEKLFFEFNPSSSDVRNVILKIVNAQGLEVEIKDYSYLNGKGAFSLSESLISGVYISKILDSDGNEIGNSKFIILK